MTKSDDKNSNPNSEIIIAKEDIKPMSARDRSVFPAALATGSQVLINSLQRQMLANGRLGVNNNENFSDLANRFTKNPATVFSGVSHRFTLQLLTQGLPMYYNRVNQDSGQKKISDSLTALWMTTAGCFFEISGLKKPVEDKAKAQGIDVNFLRQAPTVAAAVTPLVFVRNNIYAKVVFGQNKEDSLQKRLGTATAAAIITNPVDSAINILAYEGGIAKEGTPVAEIYRKTWNNFIASGIENPYQRFVKVVQNSLSGAPLRVAGVAGASLLLSKSTGDMLEEGISDYMASTSKLWSQLQNRIADKGGIKEVEEVGSAEAILPSTKIEAKKSEALSERKDEKIK